MNNTRVCPFCAEEVKREAIKCKHCGSDLSKIVQKEKIQEEVDRKARAEKKVEDKKKEENRLRHEKELSKKTKKNFAVLVGFIIGLFFRSISVPVVIIWYLWKRTKLAKKNKLIGTAIVLAIYIPWASLAIHNDRAPSITILEPENNFQVQASSIEIKGIVDPENATIMLGDKKTVAIDGTFSYSVELNNEKNNFNFVAYNQKKKSTASIVVNRIFTEEEKAKIAQEKEEARKQREIDRVQAEENRVKTEAARKLKEIEDTKNNLKEQIEIVKNLNSDDYSLSVDKINEEILLFTVWAGLANGAKKNEDAEIQKLGKELEAKLVQLQIKEYPKIRSNWGALMKNTMWKHDITVKIFGNKNGTIELIGGTFALNKNIQDTQRTLSEMLEKLRFDRINYKWYEYDNGSYYTMSSKKDSELFKIK